jgi:hypothetical protein
MHAAFKRPLSRLGVKASALLVPAIIALSLLAGCGGGGGSEAKGLLGQAEKAGGSIDSYHTSLAMFFEGGQQDGMKTEELVIDINGGDVRLKDTFYNPETGEGTVIQEVVRIGEKQYRRDLSSGAWVEEEPSLSEEAAATYTSHITDFASNSSSAEKIGVEEMNGVNAAHLRFALSPGNVSSLLPNVPPSNLESNQGGQVDIWIDESNFYPVKYDLLFRNVTIGQGMSNADVRLVIDITGINQPIDIAPPI